MNFWLFLYIYIYIDATECLQPVSIDLIGRTIQVCKEPPDFGCPPEFVELIVRVMVDHNLAMPKNRDQAKVLYTQLVSLIYQI